MLLPNSRVDVDARARFEVQLALHAQEKVCNSIASSCSASCWSISKQQFRTKDTKPGFQQVSAKL